MDVHFDVFSRAVLTAQIPGDKIADLSIVNERAR